MPSSVTNKQTHIWRRFDSGQLLFDLVLIGLLFLADGFFQHRSAGETSSLLSLKSWVQNLNWLESFALMLFNVTLPACFVAWTLQSEGKSGRSRNIGLAILVIGAMMLGVAGNVSIAVARGAERGFDIIGALFGGILLTALLADKLAKLSRSQSVLPGIFGNLLSVVMAAAMVFWNYLFLAVGLVLIQEIGDMGRYPSAFVVFNLFLSGFLPLRTGYFWAKGPTWFSASTAIAGLAFFVYFTFNLLRGLS